MVYYWLVRLTISEWFCYFLSRHHCQWCIIGLWDLPLQMVYYQLVRLNHLIIWCDFNCLYRIAVVCECVYVCVRACVITILNSFKIKASKQQIWKYSYTKVLLLSYPFSKLLVQKYWERNINICCDNVPCSVCSSQEYHCLFTLFIQQHSNWYCIALNVRIIGE